MKTIFALKGYWDQDDTVNVLVRTDMGHERPLPLYLDEVNRSPTGFAWGYGGSGPHQLAYAILRECGVEQRDARRLYHPFCVMTVAGLPQDDGWSMTDQDVLQAVEAIQGKLRAAE